MADERLPLSRRRWWMAAAVLILLLGLDLTRAPRQQLSSRALLLTIDAYQATLSKAIARSGARCRFSPSCSRYGEAVIHDHGALKGSALAAWRVLRCGPWTDAGTLDPPPGRIAAASQEAVP